jgi:hypothetical protein
MEWSQDDPGSTSSTSVPDRRKERPSRESSHVFGLVTAGEQAVEEVAFDEHALAEEVSSARFTASQAAMAAGLPNEGDGGSALGGLFQEMVGGPRRRPADPSGLDGATRAPGQDETHRPRPAGQPWGARGTPRRLRRPRLQLVAGRAGEFRRIGRAAI